MGKKNSYIPKTARGTKDIDNSDIAIYRYIIYVCREKFKLRGATELETPVFELDKTFKSLYGEEEKLIYKIYNKDLDKKISNKVSDSKTFVSDSEKTSVSDSDKTFVSDSERTKNNKEDRDIREELSLRYDLTVPFARHIAMNGYDIFKRYQIAKVYRKDKPQMDKGRYCEFYQCDYDIAGSDQDTHIFDIEVLDLMQDILSEILKDDFVIRFNDREVLFDILKKSGLKAKYIKRVCSSLDKMDKHDWSYIENELVNVKNISKDIVDNIKRNLNLIGQSLGNEFNENNAENESNYQMWDMYYCLLELGFMSQEAKSRLNAILKSLESLGILKYFKFDMTLIRGLDYYTGIIYEAEYANKDIMSSSIGGGGRYDKMIGKLSNSNIPAVGMSIGVERIFTILKSLNSIKSEPKLDIFIVSPKLRGEENTQKNKDLLMTKKLELIKYYRNQSIKTSMYHKSNAQLGKQFDFVDKNQIPLIVIYGLGEINNKTVNVKNNKTRKEVTLAVDESVEYIKSELLSI